MALPATLQDGYVAVYGLGSPTSNGWNYAASVDCLFATVVQMAPDVYGLLDRSVMFRKDEVRAKVTYQNGVYQVVQKAKLILIEDIPT